MIILITVYFVKKITHQTKTIEKDRLDSTVVQNVNKSKSKTDRILL